MVDKVLAFLMPTLALLSIGVLFLAACKAVSFLGRAGGWTVRVGVDPRRVRGPSVVLFPVCEDLLCCGLAGFVVVNRPTGKAGDPEREISELVEQVCSRGLSAPGAPGMDPSRYLSPESLERLDAGLTRLKQDTSAQHRLFSSGGLDRLRAVSDRLKTFVEHEEDALERASGRLNVRDTEVMAERLVRLKDVDWALREDLIAVHDKVRALAGPLMYEDPAYYARFQKINACLNALDRLEVRGRDSAGIQVQVCYPDLESVALLRHRLTQDALFEEFVQRSTPMELKNGSISLHGPVISFTYKTAQITGELGENTRKLRAFIGSDGVLKAALSIDCVTETYLAHTRWASVGAINETNCHPVNNHCLDAPVEELGGLPSRCRDYPRYGKGAWTVSAVLNGDIDNFQGIRNSLEDLGRVLSTEVTTDTKAIPLQVERFLQEGDTLAEAFRKAVNSFEGSHAVALQSNIEPGKVFLAQRGSGQTIYVGLLENGYMFASEIYGLVEVTSRFIKMDGETPRVPGDTSTQGQIFILSDGASGGVDGIEAMYYDGHPVTLSEKDIQTAQITTRDIDRGEHQHFLIKEILDAPSSIRKTLRGKYRRVSPGKVVFNLDETVVDPHTREMLVRNEIRKIFVVGQGTAAVAASAVAEALGVYLRGAAVTVGSRKATDLSGFMLDDDMYDTLVIAITQSGTTTDTNRAVTLARQRGARVMAIVNRRQSDITTKVHGVFYTSDGRDIEMSVASTKAFYSQIVAGYVLALFFAQQLGTLEDGAIAEALAALEQAPDLMMEVIAQREAIRKTAWDAVRRKQYWAVVGSGVNKVASDEVRIKLSELCYKTISSDIIEDKKHIDLSSEPLILVCASGSPPMVLDDIVKDVAIFKAHASTVVVIADRGAGESFENVADAVIEVPGADFPLCVILNTLAGHIWGYYAALSLDEQARTFKRFRTELQERAKEHKRLQYTVYESVKDRELHRLVDAFEADFKAWRVKGELASLSNDVASDITLLLKYARGKLPVEDFWMEFEGKRVSSSPLDMLDLTLKRAVEELSRPVDAIRHQAKTVTVGTSRKVEVPKGPVFSVLVELGFSPENVRAREVLFLKRLQGAIVRIKGYTLYRVEGLDEAGMPVEATTLSIVRREGVCASMPSRYERAAPLRGTKNTIVRTRKVYAGIGRSDNASIVVIPLEDARRVITHLLLLQVDFDEHLQTARKKDVLGVKLNDIVNLVNEYDIPWKDEYLEHFDIKVLLGEDVNDIVGEIVKVHKERGR
ncbi:MAG TPA: SIS domain-containing protein [Deltaproteobacteria bacterium]|nr:SIS domain-containing protein [Deltaproteobacteria bacterium]